MGAKRLGDDYTCRFKTRDEYLQHLEKMAQKYAMDEEFRTKQINRGRANYKTMMTNPVLHEAYKARRREYMNAYNARKRMEAGIEINNKGRRDLQPKVSASVRSEIRKEIRLLIE